MKICNITKCIFFEKLLSLLQYDDKNTSKPNENQWTRPLHSGVVYGYAGAYPQLKDDVGGDG